MFEMFTHGFSFLNLLSLAAFFTTVGLFFCGIPICRQIWKRKDTTEISGAPFLMGVLGGCCWMTYGYLKNDHTVLVVTGCQVILYSSYSIFYWFMSKDKLWITIKVSMVLALCATLIFSVRLFGMKVFHPLGIICMTLNIGDFAAPLAGLRVVIRRGATSTLPLPLCIANFLVSTEWFFYGLLVKDIYLITPNGIGAALAIGQLFLFVILPRKPGQRSLIARLCSCCSTNENEVDLEAPIKEIIPETDTNEQQSEHFTRARRWSKKVIANVNTVAEEIEHVIGKASIHHQEQLVFTYRKEKSSKFMYSQTIGDEDTASEKTVEGTIDGTVCKNGLNAFEKRDMILNPETLARKLAASQRFFPESQTVNIRRTVSSPNLTDLS
ncbi:mtN3/saliva family protein [Dictyocaulus viviparus]|uniref:Sugar transporter SWEET1 n=1 Tax=Dictyocaulus viviparus TaxID=29172 RepID=A0A0D8YB09_DICVI|nr:mtN3/saliva family protein [Dictyocaulus viviparus]